MELTGLSGTAQIVTGAAQGIGEGIARALARSGARLGLIDIAAEPLAAVAAELREAGCEVLDQLVDITDPGSVEHAVAAIEDRLGGIDGLVNVAGIQRIALLTETSLEDFTATFDVNVTGAFLMTQSVARRMAVAGKGAIVTVTSNSARVPRVRQGAYCASKAGLAQLMRVFALELGPQGIRCNTVAPGSTGTAMIRRMQAEMGFGDVLLKGDLAAFRTGIPLGKNAVVADVADAVQFLLSDQAGHITMHEMVVDGGGSLGA